MKIAKNNLVYLEYTLHDAEGEHLNPDEGELIYLHGGYAQIPIDLENAIEGKEAGDSFKVTLSAKEAFGEYDKELLVSEQLSILPEDIHVGMELDGDVDDVSKKPTVFIVVEINEDTAILDANHPLAGRTLTFEGVITEIEELDEEAVEAILAHDAEHEH